MSWCAADWSSSGIAPSPANTPEALVQVYATRTGRWKGIFAVHSWIGVKRALALKFDRWDVVGWGQPVRRNAYPVDGPWYDNRLEIILEIRGVRAGRLIPEIEAAILDYPNRGYGSYSVRPGPNLNTFLAWIGRRDGFELHILGATIGLDLQELAIKLLSIASLGFRPLWDGLLAAFERGRMQERLPIRHNRKGAFRVLPIASLPLIDRGERQTAASETRTIGDSR